MKSILSWGSGMVQFQPAGVILSTVDHVTPKNNFTYFFFILINYQVFKFWFCWIG